MYVSETMHGVVNTSFSGISLAEKEGHFHSTTAGGPVCLDKGEHVLLYA